MRAKVFFITLAVDDLERSVAFYRDGLGWPTDGITGREFHDDVTGADGTIAFFTMEDGLLLGLYERSNLAKDAGLAPGQPSPAGSAEFSLGLPAGSREEVDELLRKAEAAGATLPAPAHMRPFGVYSGYFADPDGHLFEIAWDSNGLRPTARTDRANREREGTGSGYRSSSSRSSPVTVSGASPGMKRRPSRVRSATISGQNPNPWPYT